MKQISGGMNLVREDGACHVSHDTSSQADTGLGSAWFLGLCPCGAGVASLGTWVGGRWLAETHSPSGHLVGVSLRRTPAL